MSGRDLNTPLFKVMGENIKIYVRFNFMYWSFYVGSFCNEILNFCKKFR